MVANAPWPKQKPIHLKHMPENRNRSQEYTVSESDCPISSRGIVECVMCITERTLT